MLSPSKTSPHAKPHAATRLPETSVSRKTARPRDHGLDTLRATAILTVMAFHVMELHAANTIPDTLLPVVRFCWMGVDLFFVLSGYLIGSQLLRPYAQGRRPSLVVFYLKRFFRVLPAYAVVLSLYLAWPHWREAPTMAPPWEFFTFTENLFVHYPAERAFSHVWSLCVEEHFYLFLPLIVLVLARKPSFQRTVAVLAGFVLLGIALRAFFVFHWIRPSYFQDPDARDWFLTYIKQIYYPTYSRLDGLLAGVILALLRSFRPAWWQRLTAHGHALFLSGAAFLALAIYLTRDRADTIEGLSTIGAIFAFPILSLGLALITASALSRNGILARFRIPGAQTVAILAFTLYLSHKGILHLTTLYFPQISQAGGLPWIALFLGSAFAAAAILYFVIERPFMLLRDKLLHERKPRVNEELRTEPAL